MKIIYKIFIAIVLIIGLLPFSVLANDEEVDEFAPLPIIRDLREEAKLAEQRQRPILILFSMRLCEFCAFIRQEYLIPRMNNPKSADKIIFREVQTESYKYLRDFNGEMIGADKLALRYRADLTPTLVIVNSKGEELVKKIVGITNRSYYEAELDASIDLAYKKVLSNI